MLTSINVNLFQEMKEQLSVQKRSPPFEASRHSFSQGISIQRRKRCYSSMQQGPHLHANLF